MFQKKKNRRTDRWLRIDTTEQMGKISEIGTTMVAYTVQGKLVWYPLGGLRRESKFVAGSGSRWLRMSRRILARKTLLSSWTA